MTTFEYILLCRAVLTGAFEPAEVVSLLENRGSAVVYILPRGLAVTNLMMNALVMSISSTLVLVVNSVVISLFRELIGFESIFGFSVPPAEAPFLYLFTIPPGAFLALGIFILVINSLRKGDV